MLRHAMREQRKVHVAYRDRLGGDLTALSRVCGS